MKVAGGHVHDSRGKTPAPASYWQRYHYLLFALLPYFIFPFSVHKARCTYSITRFSKNVKT